MDAQALITYVTTTFEAVRTLENAGDTFFVYDPDGDLPQDRWLPFATVVTGDTYDTVSRLAPAGEYRLNIGLTTGAYTSRFADPPTTRDEHGVLETGFDYAVRDRVMPHPHYASQHWVCVVTPGERTIPVLGELLHDAYQFACRKHANYQSRQAKR